MANTTSAKKAARKMARRFKVNKMRRTRVRGFLRMVEAEISGGRKDEARKALALAQSEIMRAVSRGIFHINTASRKISRLSARIKAL